MKSDGNPMYPILRLRNAPRCTAMANGTRERCICPACEVGRFVAYMVREVALREEQAILTTGMGCKPLR